MYIGADDPSKATENSEEPRKSSKVMIAETSTSSIPRPVSEMLKKSVLKSTSSSGSMEKLMTDKKTLDIKTTEVRSPSPIPEDLGEDGKQSPAKPDKKTEDKNKDKKEDKTKEPSETQKSREQKESETVPDEDKRKQLESSSREAPKKGDNSDEKKVSEVNQKKEAPKTAVAQATTSERGKSKATGRVTGGWI